MTVRTDRKLRGAEDDGTMRRWVGNSRDHPLYSPSVSFGTGHALNHLHVHFNGGGLGEHFN
jgi:hypothetical protein